MDSTFEKINKKHVEKIPMKCILRFKSYSSMLVRLSF